MVFLCSNSNSPLGVKSKASTMVYRTYAIWPPLPLWLHSFSSSWSLTLTLPASLLQTLGTFWTQGLCNYTPWKNTDLDICIAHSLTSFRSFPQISLSQWGHPWPLYFKLYPPHLLLTPYWSLLLLLTCFIFSIAFITF